MTSVDLEYAHLLASTLMFKRFGDEKPPVEHMGLAVRTEVDGDMFGCYRVGEHWIDGNLSYLIKPDDLWLYLSDLDVLRVKE